MQVASILWLDIKSQKISEHRFRLKWTKCSPRTEANLVNVLSLELYQLIQYSYVCSSVMSVHPEGGGSARDARVSLTSVDIVSRSLAKSCWMSTISTVCRGSRQVVTALFEP